MRRAILTVAMSGDRHRVPVAARLQRAASRSRREAQIAEPNSPLLPSDPATFDYQGETYDVYYVPMPDGTTRELALVKKGRQQSDFIDPANPAAGPITWQGSWRTLSQPWQVAPQWGNYAEVWNLIDFPRLLFNTVALALIGTIGTVLSCTLVAYGFARFRFPGRGLLFTLLLATIFLPERGHAHPDVHAVREARLGRDVAAAARPGVLRQRLRRVPDPAVPADDPARP